MWMRTGMHCMASRRPNLNPDLNGFPSRLEANQSTVNLEHRTAHSLAAIQSS